MYGIRYRQSEYWNSGALYLRGTPVMVKPVITLKRLHSGLRGPRGTNNVACDESLSVNQSERQRTD